MAPNTLANLPDMNMLERRYRKRVTYQESWKREELEEFL